MSDVTLRNVTKHFDDFVAVQDLSFEVSAGSIFGLLGPNGAGKSTTMRMIANILAPDDGELIVLEKSPSIALKRQIGYLPEDRGLYRQMKIRDQLLFFAKIKGVDKKRALARIDMWLERFGLAAWKNHIPLDLSKGMQQKVQFITTVIHDPQVLILDEPFTGLDPVSVSQLKDVILDLRQRNKTIIFSTHQMEQVEQICDEICIINHAKKVLAGTIREVKQRYGRNIVELEYEGPQEFLHDFDGAVKHFPNQLQIKLGEGSDAQEILRRAMAAGGRVHRFELVEPSLNEIFIDFVQGDNERNPSNRVA